MIFDKVCALIREQLPVNGNEITRASRLIEDLGADSANIMMLIMDIEDEYGIQVEDSMLSSVKTVGDIVEYLEKNVK